METMLSKNIIRNIKPLWVAQNKKEASELIELWFARECFSFSANPALLALKQKWKEFDSLEWWIEWATFSYTWGANEFPQIYNDINKEQWNRKNEITFWEIITDILQIDTDSEVNLIPHKRNKVTIFEKLNLLKKWETLESSIVLHSNNGNSHYAILWSKRKNWTIQFLLKNVTESVNKKIASQKRAELILSKFKANWINWTTSTFLDSLNSNHINLLNATSYKEIYDYANAIIHESRKVHKLIEEILNESRFLSSFSTEEIELLKNDLECEYEELLTTDFGQLKTLLSGIKDMFSKVAKLSEAKLQFPEAKIREIITNLLQNSIEIDRWILNTLVSSKKFIENVSQDSAIFLHCPKWKDIFVLNGDFSRKHNIHSIIHNLWWNLTNRKDLEQICNNAKTQNVVSTIWIWEKHYDITARPVKDWFQMILIARNEVKVPDENVTTHGLKAIFNYTAFEVDRSSPSEILDFFWIIDISDIGTSIHKKIVRLQAIADWREIQTEKEGPWDWIVWIPSQLNTKINIPENIKKLKFDLIPDWMAITLQEIASNSYLNWAENMKINFSRRKNTLIITLEDDWNWFTEEDLKEIRENLSKNMPNKSTRIWWSWYWILWVHQTMSSIKWGQMDISSKQWVWTTITLRMKIRLNLFLQC